MTESPDRFPWETDDDDAPLMGPAVPQGEDAGEDEPLDQPLAPFLGGMDEAEPPADEIPWLVPEGEEIIGIDDLQAAELGAEGAALAPAGDESADSDSAAPGSNLVADPGESVAPEDWAAPLDDLPGTDPLSAEQSAEEPLTGPPPGASRVAEDVARRLERIAHSLRTTDPASLLGAAADPLEVLVVGYVLGYSQAERRTGGPGAPGA